MLTPQKIFATLVLAASSLAAGAAHAGGVNWSIGINLPVPGLVAYGPPPVYVAAPPVYMQAPPPVVYAPQPVYVQPRVVYAPPMRVVEREWYPGPRHEHRHWREERGEGHGRGYYGGGHY